MKKRRIYLDTTVVSFYYAKDAPEKAIITREFFDKVLPGAKYEIFLSEVTIRELANTKELELCDKFLKLVQGLSVEVVTLTSEISQLAKQFVEEGYIPIKYREDALHLAFALVYNADYLMSWNFKHIVKMQTRESVKMMALRGGFKPFEIITPEEVVASENEV